MLNDTLSNAIISIKNYEKSGKNNCVIQPASKLILEVLKVMQKEKYIGEFKFIDDKQAGKVEVKLIGNINKCGSIKPRQPVQVSDLNKWEQRYLPTRNFGILIISTPFGVMTHKEAYSKNTGGLLLAYVY